ncbi:MAG TPA: carbamoyltransferase HypF, partial [Acidimicrobiales bacterium]|nr:carbamoyltransferase HypF [Acidimicrobiales bacterium]
VAGTAAAAVAGTDAAVAAAQRALAAGQVIAVKGLGGYHLACDATSNAAVSTLRARKHRPDKPLAVMVAGIDQARRIAFIDEAEHAVLASPARPIVLLRRRPGSGESGPDDLSPLVAPDNPYIAVMLPYTPLHHLLFQLVPGANAPKPFALVMTSGNVSDEPICYLDSRAAEQIGRMVDGWLAHDRPIHVPCDDSVVRVDNGDELPLRRSRGYAPLPVSLPFASAPVLAVGGELKNVFCLASGPDAWMSQHIGDMGSVETLAAFNHSARQFEAMYDVTPDMFAADAHPGYQTRRWAERDAHLPVALVQHHHAHIAALMAEHRLPAGERVIGFAFDGTGYGADGAIWGGEVLLAGYAEYQRAAHLAYVPLPGGDATIRKPYRAALAHLWAAGIDWDDDLAPVQASTGAELRALRRQLERGAQCVPTSSMGRLFDAVSSLLGARQVVSYEAQAAIELETVATPAVRTAAVPGAGAVPVYQFGLPFDLEGVAGRPGLPGEPLVIEAAPVLRAIVADLRRGCPRDAVAAAYHRAVASLIADLAFWLSRETGLQGVALSGGVFQNVLLLGLARDALAAKGLSALEHRLVPPNDGGLALGQAAVAAARAAGAGQAAQAGAGMDRLAATSRDCNEEVCITCSDEGKVAEVKALHPDGRADVIVDGLAATIDASLVDAAPGDLVLVHAGVALCVLAEDGG